MLTIGFPCCYVVLVVLKAFFMHYIFRSILSWNPSFHRFMSRSWIMFLIIIKSLGMMKTQQIQHQLRLPTVCFSHLTCAFLYCRFFGLLLDLLTSYITSTSSNTCRKQVHRPASLVASFLCQPLWMVGQPEIQTIHHLPWFQAQGHSWEAMASSRWPSLGKKAAWVAWPGNSKEW